MKKKLALRIAALTMALSVAQAVLAADSRKVEVPAGDLISALKALSSQAGVEFVYEVRQLQGLRTRGVSGELSAEEAIIKLLEGTNLQIAGHRSGAIVISSSPSAVIEGAAPSTGIPDGQASATSSEVTELNRVAVTGSRLQQSGADTMIPVRKLDQREAIESGYMDLVEAMRDMPGVGGVDSLTTNQGSHQGNGLSTVSLRGLGLERTLVLIDGRRTVSNAGNRNVVSLNTIPEYFIDRIEVTTGGASAVYGSDAIAGVVNIITEDQMDGFKARAVTRTTDEGGGGSIEYSLGAGSRFFDDRLYVMGALTYGNQRPLYARERDYAMRSEFFSVNSNTLTTPSLNDSIPGGRFGGSSYYYDETGLHEGYVRSENGYETREEGVLITPREMLNVGGKLTFDINDNLRFFGQVMYSSVDTRMSFAPVPASSSEAYGLSGEFTAGRIPVDNPYMPVEIAATATSDDVTWARRFTELGLREFDNQRVTRRLSTGLQGTLFEGQWDWNVAYSYGDFDGYQASTNYLNLQNLSNALNATTIDGAIVCADPVARAEGCVPVNLFGEGSISPEAAEYIRAYKKFWARNKQHTIEASISGSPFSLPAGPVQTAFGVEWRRDETSSLTDEVTRQGHASGPFIPTFTGEVTAKSAFAEARLPLLNELPMAHDLSLELALRITDNANLPNVGTTLSYRGGLQWAPIEQLMFRAAYGVAQRAPFTTELYSPPRDDYQSVVDVCHAVTAATPGTIAQNCRLDSGIAAAIAENGQFLQEKTNTYAPSEGNENLKEEAAHTLTAGFLILPWPGMEASLDYYDIEIKDVISSINMNSLLTECYSDPNGTNNKFCDPITRNEEGQITQISNQRQNLDTMRATGIDVGLTQRFNLNRFGVPGNFTLQGTYSRRNRLETTFEGLSGKSRTDFNGQIGTFKHEATAGLSWSNDHVRIGWKSVYLSDAVDSNARKRQFELAGVTDPLFLHVPSFTRHDLNISLSPIQVGNMRWRVFGNVLNVFNRYGPHLPEGTSAGGSFNYHSAYGVSGRTFSLGIEVQL